MNTNTTALSMTGMLGLALAIGSGGCGHAAISPQLVSARATMATARVSSAASLEPDELLLAERTLTAAEREEDGSVVEAHYAYVAERQTRVAMSDARRGQIEQGAIDDEAAYHEELERLARERGVALSSMEEQLTDSQQTVDAQRTQLAEGDAALSAEERARHDAEAREAAAMERLRTLATVRAEPTETVITLSGELLFVTGRSDLRPEARERLMAVAEALRAAPGQTVLIEGFTDSRGSTEHNLDLSQRRADSVRDFLLAEGVPADRVRALGRGEEEPIAGNDTAEGRANNRRVEISLRPSGATVASVDSPDGHMAP